MAWMTSLSVHVSGSQHYISFSGLAWIYDTYSSRYYTFGNVSGEVYCSRKTDVLAPLVGVGIMTDAYKNLLVWSGSTPPVYTYMPLQTSTATGWWGGYPMRVGEVNVSAHVDLYDYQGDGVYSRWELTSLGLSIVVNSDTIRTFGDEMSVTGGRIQGTLDPPYSLSSPGPSISLGRNPAGLLMLPRGPSCRTNRTGAVRCSSCRS